MTCTCERKPAPGSERQPCPVCDTPTRIDPRKLAARNLKQLKKMTRLPSERWKDHA